MDMQAFLGGVSIGKETSGNLKLSFMGDVAVRTPDGKYVVGKNGQIADVTAFILDGSEKYLLRIPTAKIKADDLVVVSDNPFKVISVLEANEDGRIKGIDLMAGTVVEHAPRAGVILPFGVVPQKVFVKVASLLEAFGAEDMTKMGGIERMMPLLLFGNAQADGSKKTDLIDTMMMMRMMSGVGSDEGASFLRPNRAEE
ncbi:hypothetical protein [Paracraurococcus lichenis]|uniref:Hedgehog/Intein (Hint) domain-containing protein n=1 Tax=Paracraurococcus lichenis TaxID=3064888 RepID=A0ABT9EDA5_9PROT|nr:hypothetical protein [Paracraurococcus sp. LOR1-02]MDO9714198.1 hypothetical protein [Paracraurococcus sp. LOR1-02]